MTIDKRKQVHVPVNSVWFQPKSQKRAPVTPLSEDVLLKAALKIADEEGLNAVSFRNLAASLKTGPMRLYGFVRTKEDLLELMIDAVYGEMLSAAAAAGDWRKEAKAIACGMRSSIRRHPWFIQMLGGRPHHGPNALAHLEQCLATLGAAKRKRPQLNATLQAAKTFYAYVIGALQSEIREQQAEKISGLTKRQWQKATAPYLLGMLDTGRFPTVALVMRDAGHPKPEEAFLAGLECVLVGIERTF